jgi:hypothetical protein
MKIHQNNIFFYFLKIIFYISTYKKNLKTKKKIKFSPRLTVSEKARCGGDSCK